MQMCQCEDRPHPKCHPLAKFVAIYLVLRPTSMAERLPQRIVTVTVDLHHRHKHLQCQHSRSHLHRLLPHNLPRRLAIM